MEGAILYGAEDYAISRLQEGKLKATELDFYRRAARKVNKECGNSA